MNSQTKAILLRALETAVLVSQEPMKDPSKDVFECLKLRILKTEAFSAGLFVLWFAATCFSSDFLPGTLCNRQNTGAVQF